MASLLRAGPSTILNTVARSRTLPVCSTVRAFHASRAALNFHFDTHRFIERLEKEGLTRNQAEGVMGAMSDVVDESFRNMMADMVTKSEQEKYLYTQKVDFAQLKSEMQLMEKNDLATMKAENDRLTADVEKLKQRLREEIARTQAGVRLDLNLEKGRLRDETSAQELKVREVDTRIESEIAGLRTAIETSKQNTLQYLVTVATGCCALLMAYLRFRM
ncbi:DUF1640-domain-containing protein [Calocera viscosa TUFC12733]|uniref:DUF1640-domain-containing protein n=1 Tax=Calocera viscosa (strain TUFC12733) TaxID=1330018 RepID=A0A167S1K4_CALVF|nr:DUF1640-domain-containing protein [Calocera viscosa TUFC12733]